MAKVVGVPASLGLGLVRWMEHYLCHGPGDLRGQPYRLDDEMAAFVWRCYRVDEHGRRTVRRAFLSRAKGRAKSEVAAALVVAELLGPARFAGWDPTGQPIGRPVVDPFIRCLATEETQTGNTYGAVAVMLDHLVEHFGSEFPRIDVGLTRTFVAGGGEIRPSTAASASKDGGKETFAVADETHLWVQPELRDMHNTVTRNLAKRKLAEPWMLETSTMYRPGQGSVAEASWDYHREVKAGRLPDRGLLVDHREGPEPGDWDDDEQMLASLRQAYGAAADWVDLDAVLAEIRDPKTTRAAASRYFLNRATQESEQWVSPAEWSALTGGELPAPRAAIALGFDGSDGVEDGDCTALVGCDMATGHLFVLGCWRPAGEAGIDRGSVKATIADAFKTWKVTRLLADPPYWRTELAEWAQLHGDKVVLEYPTASWSRMAQAVNRLDAAIRAATVSHDGDPVLAEHVSNAQRAEVNPRRPELGFALTKDRKMSPRKIDLAVAAVLAFEARDQAVRTGWKARGKAQFIDLNSVWAEHLATEAEKARSQVGR